MEVKFTKEQQELILKNYKKECDIMSNFPYVAKATAKNFLFGCIGDMLSKDVSDKIFGEIIADTSIAGMSMESNSSFLSGSGVSLSEFDSISNSLQGALMAWDESNFVSTIRNNYKNAKYFGISALGGQPDTANKIQKVRPYRVLDPLVWILSQFKYSLQINK